VKADQWGQCYFRSATGSADGLPSLLDGSADCSRSLRRKAQESDCKGCARFAA